MSKLVGIIAAMNIELELLKKEATDKQAEIISGIEFTKGEINGHKVVMAVSGEGKVNASMCAEAMILKYSPDMIINTGVGGSLNINLNIGNIAIAESVAQHDYDITFLGWPLGMTPFGKRSDDKPWGEDATVEIKCDERIVSAFQKATESLGIHTYTGVIASGDQFIADSSKKDFIVDNFSAVCCEMEGGAIGQVARLNGVPFGVVRAISDNADENAEVYEFNAVDVAKNSILVTKEFLNIIDK